MANPENEKQPRRGWMFLINFMTG